jgi:hypothetical protein
MNIRFSLKFYELHEKLYHKIDVSSQYVKNSVSGTSRAELLQAVTKYGTPNRCRQMISVQWQSHFLKGS